MSNRQPAALTVKGIAYAVGEIIYIEIPYTDGARQTTAIDARDRRQAAQFNGRAVTLTIETSKDVEE